VKCIIQALRRNPGAIGCERCFGTLKQVISDFRTSLKAESANAILSGGSILRAKRKMAMFELDKKKKRIKIKSE